VPPASPEAGTKEMTGTVDQSHVAVYERASVEALEMIYRQKFEQFVRVAQAITRARDTAVDSVQEAFASLLRNRDSYRGAGPLEAWVWRAVVNAAQRSVRAPTHVPLVEHGVIGPPAAQEDEDVRALVAGLPERQRLVLFLRYYADLDYRSIAAALDLEVGTVGATLNQAHGALKRQLAEQVGG
jgi:RNA polymerase sigma-70 factor (ECF subfamily)